MGNGGEMLRDLTPSWDTSGVFQMMAAPGSACAQFGSLIVPETNTRAAIGYRRYRDCDKNDSTGQDFAVLQGDRRHLVGVLADGVGQSFFGNLAAERVSKWLLRELWNKRAEPPGQEEMEAGLKKAEQDLSGVVEEYSLEHLPTWHRNALEGTRRTGSQAVFAAFVWEFARQSGFLYQVGDAVSIVFRSGGSERIEAHAKGRWSSAGRSQLHLLCTPLVETVGLLLKSDGADPEWGFEIDRQIADGPEFAEMASRRAEGDDVSFVAGCLVTEASVVSRNSYRDVRPASGSAESVASIGPHSGTIALSGGSAAKVVGEVPARPLISDAPFRPATGSGRFRSNVGVFAVGVVVGLLFSAFESKLAQLAPLKRWWRPQVLSPSPSQRPTGKVTGKSKGGSGSPADPTGTPGRQQALKATPAAGQTELPSLVVKVSSCEAPPADVTRFLRRDPDAQVARVTSSEHLIGLAVDGSPEHFTIRSDRDSREGDWYVFIPGISQVNGGISLYAYLKVRAAKIEQLVTIKDKPGCFSYEIKPGASDREARNPEGTSK